VERPRIIRAGERARQAQEAMIDVTPVTEQRQAEGGVWLEDDSAITVGRLSVVGSGGYA
jgi:hypothetical protein